jgi:hypothetical protein
MCREVGADADQLSDVVLGNYAFNERIALGHHLAAKHDGRDREAPPA